MARTAVETVYIGRDNEIVLELTDGGGAVDLAPVTRVVLDFPGVDVDSAAEPAAFDWTTDSTRLALRLGAVAALAAYADKTLTGRVVVYAPDWPDGLVWTESFRLRVEPGSLA